MSDGGFYVEPWDKGDTQPPDTDVMLAVIKNLRVEAAVLRAEHARQRELFEAEHTRYLEKCDEVERLRAESKAKEALAWTYIDRLAEEVVGQRAELLEAKAEVERLRKTVVNEWLVNRNLSVEVERLRELIREPMHNSITSGPQEPGCWWCDSVKHDDDCPAVEALEVKP